MVGGIIAGTSTRFSGLAEQYQGPVTGVGLQFHGVDGFGVGMGAFGWILIP